MKGGERYGEAKYNEDNWYDRHEALSLHDFLDKIEPFYQLYQ
jgi:hypothetical protein